MSSGDEARRCKWPISRPNRGKQPRMPASPAQAHKANRLDNHLALPIHRYWQCYRLPNQSSLPTARHHRLRKTTRACKATSPICQIHEIVFFPLYKIVLKLGSTMALFIRDTTLFLAERTDSQPPSTNLSMQVISCTQEFFKKILQSFRGIAYQYINTQTLFKFHSGTPRNVDLCAVDCGLVCVRLHTGPLLMADKCAFAGGKGVIRMLTTQGNHAEAGF